jgi:hypothetical protein
MQDSSIQGVRTPLDDIHYREYKILLKPERFNDPRSFRDFWKLVEESAKKYDLKIVLNPDAFVNQIREVLFYDTAAFELYNNHFILRRRTFYKDGWPEHDHELTFKFRHPDHAAAAAVDVHPHVAGDAKIKFKEELLPLRENLGGMRTMYSHNCDLYTPKAVLDPVVEDVAAAFPVLSKIPIDSSSRIALVNDMAVEEVQVNVGEIHFGHGFNGNATVAIWRDRRLETPLCGEFAFQCKFDRYDALHRSSVAIADDFYREVQLDAEAWIELGTTKTAMVYGLGKVAPTNHE